MEAEKKNLKLDSQPAGETTDKPEAAKIFNRIAFK